MKKGAKDLLLLTCEMIKENIEKEDLEGTKILVEELLYDLNLVQRLKN